MIESETLALDEFDRICEVLQGTNRYPRCDKNHPNGMSASEAVKAMWSDLVKAEAECKKMRDTLVWLNASGGLGLGKHERIEEALGKFVSETFAKPPRPNQPDFFRASGDCICPDCGQKYYDHPWAKEFPAKDSSGWEYYPLRRLCNGELVKL